MIVSSPLVANVWALTNAVDPLTLEVLASLKAGFVPAPPRLNA